MSYQITTQPNGNTLYAEAGETILQTALREGFSLPYGCRNGSCGTCMGKIIQGTVDYGPYDEATLTEADKQAGMALFCCATPQSDLVIECREIEAIKDIEIKMMPCRVEKLERIAPDVMIISLKLPANQRLQFLAGQYIDILLKDGKRRSFSLANAPHDDEYLQLHARNYPGGMFAEHVFTKMKVKDMLRFEGPLGSFFLRETAEDDDAPIIFVASGTGFAPIKSILEHTFHQDNDRKRKRNMTLYWGVRTPAEFYLLDLIEDWQKQHDHFKFIPVVSDAAPEDNWQGRAGFVHQAVMEDFDNLTKHQVYACGAPVMVKAAFADLTSQRELPTESFFSDVFTPSAPPK